MYSNTVVNQLIERVQGTLLFRSFAGTTQGNLNYKVYRNVCKGFGFSCAIKNRKSR